jgi:hypothetical protein
MPSLRAIDELESLNTSSIIDESDAGQVSLSVGKDKKNQATSAAPAAYSNWAKGINWAEIFSLFCQN